MPKGSLSGITFPRRSKNSSANITSTRPHLITAKKTALLCALAASEKKAEEIRILDLRKLGSFTDIFVLCSASSEPQIKAIANSIERSLKEQGISPHAADGYPASQWMVIDYVDVIVHIFHREKREFYGLDELWSDAKCIPFEEKQPEGAREK